MNYVNRSIIMTSMMLSTFSLHAMDTAHSKYLRGTTMEGEVPRHIIMRIFPSITFGMENFQDRPDISGLMIATIEGLRFTKDQVSLTDKTEFGCAGPYTFGERSYNAHELQAALGGGLMDRYPIHFHKQLNYLSGDEQLTIVRHDVDKEPILTEVINIPAHIKKRILKYLLNNVHLPEQQCFEFFKEIFFDQSKNNNSNAPLIEQIEIMTDESKLIAGEGLVLFSHEPSPSAIRLKHYAIALGDEIYISKFGNGGLIFVTDMASMLKFWHCNGFARIRPEVAEMQSFINNEFSVLRLKISHEIDH